MGTTADGLDLPPDVIRRLACDAEIIPAVLGTRSEVLDVGRLHRLVTPALWVALVLRDRHCTFPACTRPPVMCHAHHLLPWSTGGTTTLDNLALLCGPPSRHPPHLPGTYASTPTTDDPNSSHHPNPEPPRNGSGTDTDAIARLQPKRAPTSTNKQSRLTVSCHGENMAR